MQLGESRRLAGCGLLVRTLINAFLTRSGCVRRIWSAAEGFGYLIEGELVLHRNVPHRTRRAG
jgi:hypothetical protein